MKLSILVPTYNRIDHIQKQIKYFLDLLDRAECDYEIVVGDNSTNNDTRDYIVSLGSEKVCYFKNKTNIGYDGNVLECYKHSTGDFIWLMGDKNYVIQEYIDMIINTLLCNPSAVLLFERADQKKILFDNVSDIVDRFGFRLSQLNCAIINSKCLLTIENCEKYKGLNFIHIAILIEYLCSLDSLNVIWLPYSAFNTWTMNRNCWNKNVFSIFARDWFYSIMSLPSNVSVVAKLRCLRGEKSRNHIFASYNILLNRCRGNMKYSFKDLKENREFIEMTSSTTYNRIRLSMSIPLFFIYIPYIITKTLHKLRK